MTSEMFILLKEQQIVDLTLTSNLKNVDFTSKTVKVLISCQHMTAKTFHENA